MILFMLWVIVLILFWPLALLVALAWMVYAVLRVCFGVTLFALKTGGEIAASGVALAQSDEDNDEPKPIFRRY